MSKIEQLHKNLDDLSPDELRDFIRKVRADRRISKEPRKVRQARVKREDNTKTKLEKLASNLSADDLATLLAQIEGGSDETPEGEDS